MNRDSRRSIVADTVLKRAGITRDGGIWLLNALDPFSDNNGPCAGYPDMDDSLTVVRALNFESTITKPAGAAAAWDLQISTTPICNERTFDAGHQASNNAKFVQTAEAYGVGFVNAIKCDAGEGFFPDSPLTLTNWSCTNIVDVDFLQIGRVVGAAIEVIDMSNVVSKQGALTVYSFPSDCLLDNEGVWESTAGTEIGRTVGPIFGGWAATPAQAILLKSSRQWEAKDGAYMSLGFNSIDNPMVSYANRTIKIFPNQQSRSSDCLCIRETVVESSAAPIPSLVMPSYTRLVPMGFSGVILSGLHNDASILVRTKVIIESAARPEDTFVSLAVPSSGYDYKALALYSFLRHTLPLAVPVGENASGDWLRRVMSLIRDYAPVIGRVINPLVPGAALLGSTAGQVAGLVDQRKPKLAKKKPQQKRMIAGPVGRRGGAASRT